METIGRVTLHRPTPPPPRQQRQRMRGLRDGETGQRFAHWPHVGQGSKHRVLDPLRVLVALKLIENEVFHHSWV